MSKLNDHFQKQIDQRGNLLPENMLNNYIREAQIMSQMDISTPIDQKFLYIIRMHTPDILKDILGRDPSDTECAKVSVEVFEKKDKIKNMFDFMTLVGDAVKNFGLEKKAYPHLNNSSEPKDPYNINFWMNTTRKIYDEVNEGASFEEAKDLVTENWDPMEKIDYTNWLEFYQEGVPDKYPALANNKEINIKEGIAKYWEPEGQSGIAIPFGQALRSRIPSPIRRTKEDQVETEVRDTEDNNSARDRIEVQRSRIISRLNSAEKLLYTLEGQLFSGDDQEAMLRMLHDLKRKVQTSNKLSVSSTLFEDHIVKEANLQSMSGNSTMAGILYKVAQPTDPMGGLGGMSGEEGQEGSQEAQEPESEDSTKIALQEFADNMNTGTSGDNSKRDRESKKRESKKDKPTNKPPAGKPPAPVSSPTGPGVPPVEASKEDADIVIFAQGLPTESVDLEPPRVQETHETPPELEPTKRDSRPVVEDKADRPKSLSPGVVDDKTDDVIEAALKNITVDDAINRLKMLVGIYKKREIARQLAILDIMLDRLGLASYFPPIGESLQKSLEGTQYISTRLEDVLNKLMGSAESLQGENIVDEGRDPPPETAEIRKSLQVEQERDEARRQARKNKEFAKLEEKPESSIGEEVTGPINVEPTAPVI